MLRCFGRMSGISGGRTQSPESVRQRALAEQGQASEALLIRAVCTWRRSLPAAGSKTLPPTVS